MNRLLYFVATVTLEFHRCEAFERYLEGMEVMRKLYGVSRAFVCTDDPGVISQLDKVRHFRYVLKSPQKSDTP